MSDLGQAWECVAEFSGHSGWIYGVSITSNRMLASVDGNNVLLWNPTTKKLDCVLAKHTDCIFSIALSSNDQFLATGSLDKTVGLWSLETKKLICTLAQRKDPIHSVAFSPDSKLLASGGERKYKNDNGQATTIYLWNVDSKELVRTFSGHDLRVNALAFSPDGKSLASGSNDKTVRLWDVISGEQLHVLQGHSNNIATVAFTPDGNRLISSGGGGVKIWDVQTGELQQTFAEELEYVRCFAIDPTGQLLAFEVYDGIEIWDLGKHEKLHYLDFLWATSIAFSPDGKLLASGDATAFAENGGLVKVWLVPEGEVDLEPQEIEEFDPENIEDARKKVIVSITQRQGQAEFRQNLINAYDKRCCITGCDVEQALEAAHIIPYRGAATNLVSNGLLLRADIHTLFDLYLITINPISMIVEIAPQLANTHYAELADKRLCEPKNSSSRPSVKGLEWHYGEFLKKQNLA